MKHLKTFETNSKFKVGDIVRCFKFEDDGELCIIKNIDSRHPYSLPYFIEDIKDDDYRLWVGDKDIIKATKQEIEQYELDKYTNKYNL